MSLDNTTPNVEVAVVQTNNLAQFDRAEIDMQIATAKQFPRSVAACLDNARALIKMDKESAKQSFYLLDFYDKKNPVIGPSIRMAEILASCWKNIRYGSRPLERTATSVIAQGYCYDLENNVAFTATKTRPILKKDGTPFKEADIIKTMLGAQAIAERDAILKVIPRAFANGLMQEAMIVAEGSEKTTEERQEEFIKYFAGKGISAQQVQDFLGLHDYRDMGLRHFQILRALCNSVKDGFTTFEEAFAKETPANAPAPIKEVDPTAFVAKPAPTESGHKADDAPKPAGTRADIIMEITRIVEAGVTPQAFDAALDTVGITGQWDKATAEQLRKLRDALQPVKAQWGEDDAPFELGGK